LAVVLEAQFVQTGLVERQAFLAGYGAAQAMPGPLFSFAAYLRAVHSTEPSGIRGAFIALLSIYLPSALLVMGTLPFWDLLRNAVLVRSALLGVNAAVVGLLAAAFYSPILPEIVTSPAAMAIAAGAFVGLAVWSLPVWAIVLAAASAGFLAI
jgi:chromate transporter